MKIRRLWAVIVVLATTAGLGLFASGCRHRSPEQRAAWMVKKVTNELDLSELQKAKLQAVADFVTSERKAHSALREEAHAFALAQLKSDSLNRKEIERRINVHLDQMKQKAPRLIELVAEFHASLSAEQRAKAAGKIERFHEHWGHHSEE